jgi:O-antigen/teichoic acid export membrane protein
VYTRYFETVEHGATAEYGVLEMLDLVVQIAGMIFALGLANAAMRHYEAAKTDDERRRVCSTAHLSAGMLALFGGLLIAASSGLISEHLIGGRPERLVWMIAGSSVATSLVGIPMAYLRIRERSATFLRISLVQLGLGVSLNIVFVVAMGMGAEGVILSGLITNGLIGAYMTWLLLSEVGVGWHGPEFKKLARFGGPLLISALGTFLITSGDRFVLEERTSLDSVGLYGVAYKIGFLVQILAVGPFFMVWQPRSYVVGKEPDAPVTFARVFSYFVAGLCAVALLFSVFADDFMWLMTTPKFYSGADLVPWVAFAYVFNGCQVFCRIGIYLNNRTEIAGIVMLLMAVLAVGASWFAVGAFEVQGAAITTFVSYALLALTMAVVGQRLYPIPYEFRRLFKILVCVLIALGLSRLDFTDNVILSILWHGACFFSYLVALRISGFFSMEERRQLTTYVHGLRERIQGGS